MRHELAAMRERATKAEARLKDTEELGEAMKHSICDLLNDGTPMPDYGDPDGCPIPHQANPHAATCAVMDWDAFIHKHPKQEGG